MHATTLLGPEVNVFLRSPFASGPYNLSAHFFQNDPEALRQGLWDIGISFRVEYSRVSYSLYHDLVWGSKRIFSGDGWKNLGLTLSGWELE